MTARSLDLRILRKGRFQQEIHITADVNDVPALQASLQGWLDGGGWDPKLRPEFSAEVRFANEGQLRKTVRVA